MYTASVCACPFLLVISIFFGKMVFLLPLKVPNKRCLHESICLSSSIQSTVVYNKHLLIVTGLQVSKNPTRRELCHQMLMVLFVILQHFLHTMSSGALLKNQGRIWLTSNVHKDGSMKFDRNRTQDHGWYQNCKKEKNEGDENHRTNENNTEQYCQPAS